jgi:hypothetical protein
MISRVFEYSTNPVTRLVVVDEFLIAESEQRVHFPASGVRWFSGIGARKFLIPVEAVALIATANCPS